MATNSKNQLLVDFENNPELKSLFAGWSVGSEYELTVKFQLDSLTDGSAQCTLTQITANEPEPGSDEGETEIGATRDEPVLMVMHAGKDKKTEPVTAAY